VAETPARWRRCRQAYCARQRFAVEEFEKFRLSLGNREAIQHLLEVASGIDSQMLGETEDLRPGEGGLMRRRRRRATRGGAEPRVSKTFSAAETTCARTPPSPRQEVSVANVAVDLAVNIFGDSVVAHSAVGGGEIGEKTAGPFRAAARRARRCEPDARTPPRNWRRRSAARRCPSSSAGTLGDFDIVVCSTAAPHRWSRRRPPPRDEAPAAQPLFFIDLAMPRDVDPAMTSLDNVYLTISMIWPRSLTRTPGSRGRGGAGEGDSGGEIPRRSGAPVADRFGLAAGEGTSIRRRNPRRGTSGKIRQFASRCRRDERRLP